MCLDKCLRRCLCFWSDNSIWNTSIKTLFAEQRLKFADFIMIKEPIRPRWIDGRLCRLRFCFGSVGCVF